MESSATATCCEELLEVKKNLAVALERAMVSLACVVAITDERDSVTTRYEDLRLSVKQRLVFDN